MTGLRTKIHLAALFLLPLIVAAFGITTAGGHNPQMATLRFTGILSHTDANSVG